MHCALESKRWLMYSGPTQSPVGRDRGNTAKIRHYRRCCSLVWLIQSRNTTHSNVTLRILTVDLKFNWPKKCCN